VSQGDIVANSLADYLTRHPEIENGLSREENQVFYTTGDTESFNQHASVFLAKDIISLKVKL